MRTESPNFGQRFDPFWVRKWPVRTEVRSHFRTFVAVDLNSKISPTKILPLIIAHPHLSLFPLSSARFCSHLCPASGNLAINDRRCHDSEICQKVSFSSYFVKRSRSSSFAFSNQCIGHSLIARAPVAEWRRHETSFTAKAVRQRGHTLTTLTFSDRIFKRFVEEGPTLRESLLSNYSFTFRHSELQLQLQLRQVVSTVKFAILEHSPKHLVVPPRQRTRPQFVWPQQRFVFNPLFSCSSVNPWMFSRNSSAFETRHSRISGEFTIISMSQMSRHSTCLIPAISSLPCILGRRKGWFWVKVIQPYTN